MRAGPGRRRTSLRVAHDIGHGADALSVASKWAPGQSSRSHTADEFRASDGDRGGIAVYENYIEKLALEYGKTLG